MRNNRKRNDIKRILKHSWEFYTKRFTSILVGFSLLFIIAYAVLAFAQLPSYPALGAVFMRTISIPDLSATDFIVIGFTLILSNFIVADAIVNINLLIKKKRTFTEIPSEVWKGATTYATRIFSILIILFLLMLLFQLLTVEITVQPIIYPALLMLIGLLLFFTPPAIVIDEEDAIAAIVRSIELLLRSPLFYLVAILLWGLAGLAAITITGFIAFALLPIEYASIFIMLINSIFIYPFLLILQTHIYMEKYPLAK